MDFFSLIFVIVPIFIGLTIIVKIYQLSSKRSQTNIQEHQEDKQEFYTDRPRPVRKLEHEEIEFLQRHQGKHIMPEWIRYSLIIVLMICFLYLIPASLFFVLFASQIYQALGIAPFFILPVTFACLIFFIYIIFFRHDKYRFDLYAPVFGTTGKSNHFIDKNKKPYLITVREVPISKYYEKKLFRDLISYPEGTDIYVEYSPHSKKVWSAKVVNRRE